MTSHGAYYRCVLSFWMPVAQVFFDFSAVFLEILQGLFSTKKPTSTEHLMCHHFYIIKRVLLKSMLLSIYSFNGPFHLKFYTEGCHFGQKRVFVQYSTCTHKGLSNQSDCFCILTPTPPPPPPPPPHLNPEYVYMHSIQHGFKLLYHMWRRWPIQMSRWQQGSRWNPCTRTFSQ